MRVREIMTSDPAWVAPETSLKDVARLLTARGISGVPVLEDRRVVGVVAQTDVVALEQEAESATLRGRLVARVRTPRGRKYPRTAREAMSAPAITVDPRTSVVGAAWLMTTSDVERLPVVDNDSLVGIVTRTDLVRAFARSDEQIAREIVEDVLPSLAISPNDVRVEVTNGEVSIDGELEDERDWVCLQHALRAVIGVIEVRSTVRPVEPHDAMPVPA